jgi:hypothetical protein
MSGVMLIFQPDSTEPTAQTLTAPPDRAALQAAVGGDIEKVPWFNTINLGGSVRPCVAFCNEEGKQQGLPINDRATELWTEAQRGHAAPDHRVPTIHDVLVGPVVVIIGDRELLATL